VHDFPLVCPHRELPTTGTKYPRIASLTSLNVGFGRKMITDVYLEKKWPPRPEGWGREILLRQLAVSLQGFA
jgi:hypothetical protein